MKRVYLLFLLLPLMAMKCKKTDDEPTLIQPKTPLEMLPPATTTGANRAGALANGEAFYDTAGSFGTTNITAEFYHGNFNFFCQSI